MASVFMSKLRVLATLMAVCIGVYALNGITGGALNAWGIHPRQLHSLPAIFWAPFLHGNLWHLMNNLLGLAVFGFLCLLRGQAFFWRNSLLIITLGGLLVWLLGRNANHIGASGWIFGLWSLCIAQAWFERSFKSVAIALFVVVFYGGMLWGVLPSNPWVSFESHLMGAIAGVVAAALGKKRRR